MIKRVLGLKGFRGQHTISLFTFHFSIVLSNHQSLIINFTFHFKKIC